MQVPDISWEVRWYEWLAMAGAFLVLPVTLPVSAGALTGWARGRQHVKLGTAIGALLSIGAVPVSTGFAVCTEGRDSGLLHAYCASLVISLCFAAVAALLTYLRVNRRELRARTEALRRESS